MVLGMAGNYTQVRLHLFGSSCSQGYCNPYDAMSSNMIAVDHMWLFKLFKLNKIKNLSPPSH